MTTIAIPTTTRPIIITDAPPARRVNPAQLLAAIEAIPETPENYRQLREAIHEAKALVAESAPAVLGYMVVSRNGSIVGNQHEDRKTAQVVADEWTNDCKEAGIDWDYRVATITEASK